MKYIKLLRSFLGLDDKRQAQKTEEVSKYLDDKKALFHKDLQRIKKKADKIGDASAELKDIVDDIVSKIYKATREEHAHE